MICCVCVVALYFSPFPQDGGSLLLPAAESGNMEVFDWLVYKYKLSPDQWSEVSH